MAHRAHGKSCKTSVSLPIDMFVIEAQAVSIAVVATQYTRPIVTEHSAVTDLTFLSAASRRQEYTLTVVSACHPIADNSVQISIVPVTVVIQFLLLIGCRNSPVAAPPDMRDIILSLKNTFVVDYAVNTLSAILYNSVTVSVTPYICS